MKLIKIITLIALSVTAFPVYSSEKNIYAEPFPTFDDLILVYGKEQEQGTSVSDQFFVAGSIYGGLIFTLENGLVTEIFMGAAAE